MFKDAAGGVEVSIFFILLKSRQSLETEFRTVSQVHFLVERLVHAKLVSLITFLEEALPKQDTMLTFVKLQKLSAIKTLAMIHKMQKCG